MSSRTQGAQSSDSSGASAESHASIQRGRACLTCRRRKLKCDGGRPVCQQCIRSHLHSDCEYADSQGRTRTQMLEDEVARLQTVIQELENPTSATGNITLHNPYAGCGSRGRAPGATAPVMTRTTSNASGGNAPWWELDHPPKQIVERLIQRFLPHAQQLGFAMNIPRFLASVSIGPGGPGSPHTALLNAVFLWSAHLSASNNEQQQQALLSRVISGLTDALGSADPRKRIQALQAEVLLALYFFCTGRFLEGKYHSNAAVSLALSCGLNVIRSAHTSGGSQAPNLSPSALLSGGTIESASAFIMAPAGDMVEEGERINVFWSVFNIDRCWSVATGSPTMLYDDITLGTRIDTPWPLPMEMYEQMNQQTTATFSKTVQRFLAGEPGQSPQNEASGVALRAKASALFYEATRLAAAWSPAKSQSVISDMQRLHQVISKFIRSLMPLQEAGSRSHDLGLQMITVYTLAHGSMLQLHNVRAEVDADAAKFCMNHATEIIRLLDYTTNDHDGKLDYIAGTVWVAAAHVFTRERNIITNSPINAKSNSTKSAFEVNITRVVTALSNLTACPVLRLQAAKIQGALQA